MTKYGMATETSHPSLSEVTSSPNPATTINHVQSENNFLPITSHKLNGHNFLQWSQSVKLYICGKGKDDHLTGASTAPNTTDPLYKSWKSENSMVMAWLINSMVNEIGENFLLYSIAKEIWDAARDTYSSSDNTSELFSVESMLHDLRQGEMSVTNYFNMLTRYWQQLDLFEVHEWRCKEDRTQYQKIVETKRIFKFLMGLNKELDEVRGRILGTKPLPPIR